MLSQSESPRRDYGRHWITVFLRQSTVCAVVDIPSCSYLSDLNDSDDVWYEKYARYR